MTPPPAFVELPVRGGFHPWLTERCEHHLAEARAAAERLRDLGDGPTLERVRSWDEVHLHLDNVSAVASLMANVHPDPEVQETAERFERESRRLLTELNLDRSLYDVLARADDQRLSRDAARMLTRSLQDFERAGVDRDPSTGARLRALSARETELTQEFSKNIRESVGRLRVAPERLEGLPEDFVATHPVGPDGLVELTTEYPDYVPVMTFAVDRTLRSEMVTAFLNRAWPANDEVLRELLQVRAETASTLGYHDWPTYDAEIKMIGSGPAIAEFVDRISQVAASAARRDFGLLLERVRRDQPGAAGIDAVDKSFYTEALRRERFDVDASEIRRYFDFAKVRRGLLEVTGRLFGLEYVEVPDAPTWHDEVTAYDVLDRTSGAEPELLGRMYLDLHPREGKYSHAAQFTLAPGVRGRQLPEGVLVCNFSRGLMEHRDVVTLFHEFGHLVHHVLGGHQEWVRFSGVATEWDFVEAPSQLLEEWAWDHRVLSTFATDEAGEVIPAELVRRMRTADELGKGFQARTQMFYASLSYEVHHEVPEDLTAMVEKLQERYDLFDYLPGTHFHASFGHLGGYSSAYYTYMWSLVIAKDLFSAFDPEDLFADGVAGRYRQRVLSRGGAADAADLVADFLGRAYAFDAFEAWLNADG